MKQLKTTKLTKNTTLIKSVKSAFIFLFLLFLCCSPAAAAQVYTLEAILMHAAEASRERGAEMLLLLHDGREVSIMAANDGRFLDMITGEATTLAVFTERFKGHLIEVDFIVERMEQENHYFIVESRSIRN